MIGYGKVCGDQFGSSKPFPIRVRVPETEATQAGLVFGTRRAIAFEDTLGQFRRIQVRIQVRNAALVKPALLVGAHGTFGHLPAQKLDHNETQAT